MHQQLFGLYDLIAFFLTDTIFEWSNRKAGYDDDVWQSIDSPGGLVRPASQTFAEFAPSGIFLQQA